MKNSNFRLNQNHWKYSAKITNGLSEERLCDDTDEDLYGDAFEGDDFDEVLDNNFAENLASAA